MFQHLELGLLGHYLLYSIAELVVFVFVGLKMENKF